MNDRRLQFSVMNDIMNDIVNDERDHNIVIGGIAHRPDGSLVNRRPTH